VANVFRDIVVSEMSTMLPTFLLEKNKGYGTKKHIDGLLKAGLSALHRKTYCKTFLLARLNRNAI
jgi:ribonuclease HII